MSLKTCRIVGVSVHVSTVRVAITKSDMHDSASQRTIGTGPDHEADICLLQRPGFVDIHNRDPGAP